MFVPALQSVPSLSFPPVAYVRDGARRYGIRAADTVPSHVYERVRLDPVVGAAIAAAYMAAPSREERAYPAYAAFCRETVRQYHFLVGRVEFGGLGLTVSFVDEDPYTDVTAMVQDVQRHRLKVWSSAATGNRHPYLSDAENDMFRAVHDVFGHAASGRGFDRHGEEASWLKHSGMYSQLARRALTTETRGQNCAQIFHYGGGRFAEQKAVLLPPKFSRPSPRWMEPATAAAKVLC